MTYTRIYENIYTFPVQTKSQLSYQDGTKYFFEPCPEIKNKTIKALSISYYNSIPSQTDQAYFTFKNCKGETLAYNYPAVDLMDTTSQQPVAIPNYKLRLFNWYDIDLNNSYYTYIDVSGPLNTFKVLFNLNFYLE